MLMHDPTPPGVLLGGWIAEHGMSATNLAARIGVSHTMMQRILEDREAITIDLDRRLSEILGTSPGHWMKLQAQRDQWKTTGKAHPPDKG